MKLQQIMKLMDEIAPLRLAEAWDNVGLLLGDPTADISKVMTCLTLSPDVAEEAVAEKADLVISHHPILFRPAKAIRADQPGTDIVWKLATRGVAVLSYHTAWDGAIDGANAYIANALGLTEVVPIRPAPGPDCVKFVVFVSEDNLESVRNAAFKAGAGHIGNYRECSFSTPGMGTFCGQEGANPTIGQVGSRENATEHRLEIICYKAIQRRVLDAIKQAHSYEEPAIDIYSMAGVATQTADGVGRIGNLSEPLTIEELAKAAAIGLRSSATQFGRLLNLEKGRKVRSVAIACGAGDDLVDSAISAGAEVLVTGELRFHTVLKVRESGLATVILGHYASERRSMEFMADLIQQKCPDLKVWASRLESDPIENV